MKSSDLGEGSDTAGNSEGNSLSDGGRPILRLPPKKILRLIGCIFALAFHGQLPAAEHRGPQEVMQVQPPLQYELAVTLKLFQVTVVDKDGKIVRDLSRDDFVVYDSGRQVSITEFEKHDALSPIPGGEPSADVSARTAGPVVAKTLGRKFLVFLDFAFNSAKGVVASTNAVSHFLDTYVAPGDEVALFSYSISKGLRIHEYLTTDLSKIREAMAGLSAKDFSGRADVVEKEYWELARLAGEGGGREVIQELGNLEAQRRQSMYQARDYVQSLTDFAKALRPVQGQKNFLFFSTGAPYSLIYSNVAVGPRATGGDLFAPKDHGAIGSAFQQSHLDQDTALRPLYEDMLKEFSASGCSVYAFDTRESAKDTSLFGYDSNQFEKRLDSGFRGAGSLFQEENTTGADSLRRLSRQTGGQFFGNIREYKATLGQVQEATGTYYVLGYPIRVEPDGRFHQLRVEVKRKDCQARVQAGYFNPKPFREYSKVEKEIHLFDLALNPESELQTPKELATSAIVYDAGEGARLRTVSRIARDALDGFEGKTLEIVALVFGDKDSIVSLQRTTGEVSEYKGKNILFSTGIPAKPGSYRCRLVLRDLDTGKSAVGSASAFVPNMDNAKIVAFSPLIVAFGDRVMNIDGAAKGALDFASWRDVYPYDGTEFSPVLAGQAVESARIRVLVPFQTRGIDPLNVHFSAHLIDAASGRTVTVPFSLLERRKLNNTETAFIELQVKDAPRGKYVLYVNIVDKASAARTSVHVPLTLQ